MPTHLQVKADVINELRNKLYYNQIEVQRLLNNQAGVTHKEAVDSIILYLKENVEAETSIELIERYIPTPQEPQVPQKPAPSVTDEAIKKID